MKLKVLFVIAALAGGTLHAQTVEIRDAWVRAAVPGQKATGAFMKITAKANTQLVGASSPAAGVAEVHEMKMNGDIMTMRAVSALELPAGKLVELKPGGYHVMLMDMKTVLRKDSAISLTLVFKDDKGVQSKIELAVPVVTVAPGAKAAGKSAMDGHQH